MSLRFPQYILLLATVLFLSACEQEQSQLDQQENAVDIAEQLAGEISLEQLKKDITWLADDARQGRRTGTAAEDEVGLWLAQRYKSLGLKSFSQLGLQEYHHKFPVRHKFKSSAKKFGENLIGLLVGNEQADEYVVVSAHYDHLGIKDNKIYNGADDNATGVAALLEIARAISATNEQPKKSILFVAFSGEEQNLQGARHFCRDVTKNKLADKMLNLNFEMFGAAEGRGNYLHIWSTEQTKPIVEAVRQSSQMVGFPLLITPSAGFKADARALQACGINATTMDVGGGADFRTNHPHYHKPSDTIEQIDFDGVLAASKIAVATVWKLANP